ncbi:MAG: hypothetical protein VB957_13185 [Pseudomonadales bacterium]|jgi:hypothetical protein
MNKSFINKTIMNMRYIYILPFLILASTAITSCTTTEVVDNCAINLKGSLDNAIYIAERKLSSGCEYSFDNYLGQLLAIAADNPSPDNKRSFSDFLIRASDNGTISKRQAKSTYNRYFNIKFVSLAGEYNTCSQTCPSKAKVLAAMRLELRDKELGLVKASDDTASYYRADHLLKEVELVLEATCRACEAGSL